jgi:F-type H+-transporting ATPase subunit b
MKKFLVIALFAVTVTVMGQERAEPAKPGEHAAEAEEPSILWKWINFAILAGGLGYLMAKTLPKVFAERTSEIQKNITEAQQVKRDAEARAAQMDARLKALGADIETFRKQAATEMQQEGERIRQETTAQIKKVEQQAALEIEAAGKTATRELRQYSAELALKLAEERVRARLDAASESALVDGFVKELGSRGSKN